MKKIKSILVVLFLSLLTTSCSGLFDMTGKGVFAIENQSADETLVITNVMVKEELSSDYHSIFNGKIYADDIEYFTIPEGKYFVQITITEKTLIGLERTTTKETGWNVVDKKHSPFLVFDGEQFFAK